MWQESRDFVVYWVTAAAGGAEPAGGTMTARPSGVVKSVLESVPSLVAPLGEMTVDLFSVSESPELPHRARSRARPASRTHASRSGRGIVPSLQRASMAL